MDLTPRIPYSDVLGGGESARGIHRLLTVPFEVMYALRYWRGLRMRYDKVYRLEGTLFHISAGTIAAEQMVKGGRPPPPWFTEKKPDGSPVTLLDRLEEAGVGFPEEVRNALDFADYYRAATIGERFEVIAPERELSVELGWLPEIAAEAKRRGLDKEIVTTRPDWIGLENGLLYGIDYKSTRNTRGPELPAWRSADNEYELSPQMIFQERALRLAYGAENVGGVLIRRLKKNRPFFYDTQPLNLPAHMHETVAWQILNLVDRERDLRARLARGEKPASCLGLKCQHQYGACDYVNVCKSRGATLKLVVATEFKRETPK